MVLRCGEEERIAKEGEGREEQSGFGGGKGMEGAVAGGGGAVWSPTYLPAYLPTYLRFLCKVSFLCSCV